MSKHDKVEAIAKCLLRAQSFAALLEYARTAVVLGTLDEEGAARALADALQDVIRSGVAATKALAGIPKAEQPRREDLN